VNEWVHLGKQRSVRDGNNGVFVTLFVLCAGLKNRTATV
jgi:hypothetical protein